MDPVKQMYDKIQRDLDEQHEGYSPPPVRFRASESGDCSRRIWYRLSGFKPEKPKSVFMELLTSMGDLMHDVLRWRFKNAGVEMFDLTFDEETGTVVEDNQRAVVVSYNDEKFTVSFRADGGVVIDGVPHVLEVKSIDGFSYSAMKRVFDNGGWPALIEYLRDDTLGSKNRGDKYAKWFGQATITGMLSKPPVTHGYIVVGDRSMGQFGFDGSNEGMSVELCHEDLTRTLAKFAYISKAVRDGEPPMPEYMQTSKECSYCPFFNRCWKG